MKSAPLLNYRERGHGPVVVLLHGYLASSQYWDQVSQELSVGHRVIAFDLLGFGKSPKPYLSRYDYNAQIASINATLEHLGINGSFTLVGHSMGALLALRYASRYQNRVNKLVLANMPVFLSRQEAKQDIMGTNLVYRIGLQRGLHHVMWPLFVASTYLRLLPGKVAEGAVDRRNYLFQNRSWSRLRSMRNVIFAATIQADLARLDVTTTLISGLGDRQQYLRNLPKLRQARHIVSRSVSGGHHLPITHPGLVSQIVA